MRPLKRGNKVKALLLLLAALLLSPSYSYASSGEEGELDVKNLVLHHLADSYWWHITDIGDRSISIPLPVIVRSKQTGWSVFLSSRLEGGATYNGYHIAEKEPYDGKIVEYNAAGEEVRPFDISITKNVLGIFINCGILLLVILPLARWYRRREDRPVPPKGFRGAVEMLLVNIHDEVIKPCVGED